LAALIVFAASPVASLGSGKRACQILEIGQLIMRTDLHSGLTAGLRKREQVDTGSRIEQIVRAMAVIQKQITALHKQLENSGDPAVRMQIRDEIQALQDMLETMRRQILMLTQMEERRKQMREQNAVSQVAAYST
jgi:hypothetical protein